MAQLTHTSSGFATSPLLELTTVVEFARTTHIDPPYILDVVLIHTHSGYLELGA